MSDQGKRSPRLCYLCGEPGADTRDHVPPRGMFPKEPKGNLITVPAHKACNEAFSQDDERFRNFIVAAGSLSPAGFRAWRHQVLPSFRKNRKGFIELRDSLVLLRAPVPAGEPDTILPGIQLDGALVGRQIKRIVRGLFYQRFRAPLPRDWPIEVYRESQQIIDELERLGSAHGVRLGWHEVEPRVFSYCYGVLDEDSRVGLAAMAFFDREVLLAFHGREERLNGALSA